MMVFIRKCSKVIAKPILVADKSFSHFNQWELVHLGRELRMANELYLFWPIVERIQVLSPRCIEKDLSGVAEVATLVKTMQIIFHIFFSICRFSVSISWRCFQISRKSTGENWWKTVLAGAEVHFPIELNHNVTYIDLYSFYRLIKIYWLIHSIKLKWSYEKKKSFLSKILGGGMAPWPPFAVAHDLSTSFEIKWSRWRQNTLKDRWNKNKRFSKILIYSLLWKCCLTI